MKRYLFIFLSLLMVASFSYAAQPAKKKPQANTPSTTSTQTYSSVAGESRVALVIGNSAYTNSPLKNPTNDAKDMAIKLRALGFDVIERNNLQAKQIGRTLSEFRNKLSAGSVALVFYAGHGLQIKGENYLPAVDADIAVEEDVPNQSLSVKQIMDVLDGAKSRLNLVFLDACRNNPYARSFRSTEGGLARVSAPSGTLISYATRPGSVAADGEGRNGLYTSKLLAQMDTNQQIEQSLKRVVSEVKSASQGKQEPWMEGSIEGDFCFNGCNTGASTQVATLTPEAASESVATSASVKTKEQIEDEYWDEIKDSGDIASLEQYRQDYPKGRYFNTAKIKIAQLKKQGSNLTPITETTPPQQGGEADLWIEVQKTNSKEDYQAYLAQYPKGKYVALAKSRIKKLDEEAAKQALQEEQSAWEMANSAATEESYSSYLSNYPKGRYQALAKARLDKLKKQAAQASRPAETTTQLSSTPGSIIKDCADCPEMVVIPTGSFDMANPKPTHRVTIKVFALGKTEITRGQYAAFVNATGRSAGDGCTVTTATWLGGFDVEKMADRNWRNPGYQQSDNDPVACITWDDAKAYAEWLTKKTGKLYRLPSEAEWEYAERAGTTTKNYWGDTSDQACGYANVADITAKSQVPGPKSLDFPYIFNCTDNVAYTSPVASYKANSFGLYDMIGNVSEWMEDCATDDNPGAPRDGSAILTGDCKRHVQRGGSWFGYTNTACGVCRGGSDLGVRHFDYGFRIARTLP